MRSTIKILNTAGPGPMTCHCETYVRTNYPDRHNILSCGQVKNVGYHCERLLMVTLSWVFFYHTIIYMIPVLFWCISIEVKYWWFDIFTRFYTNLIHLLNMSFADHVCCCFIVCNNIIYQLTRTHNWLGPLREIFSLLTILCGKCGGGYCV